MFFHSEPSGIVEIPLTLFVNSSSLSLPSACVGTSSQVTFIVSSSGNTTEAVYLTDNSDQFTFSPSVFSMAGGITSQTITVTFTPTKPWGLKNGILTLSSSGGNIVNVQMSGNAVAVPLVLTSSVTAVDFPDLAVGSTYSKTLTISAGGFSSVEETVIVTDNSDQFSYSPSSFNLSGSGSQIITTTFSPTSLGVKTGNLTISSSGGSTKVIPMQGLSGPNIIIHNFATTLTSGQTVTLNLTGAQSNDLLIVYSNRLSIQQYNVQNNIISSPASANWSNLSGFTQAGVKIYAGNAALATYINCAGQSNGTYSAGTPFRGEANVVMKRLTAADLSGEVKVSCFNGSISYMVIRNVGTYDFHRNSSNAIITTSLTYGGGNRTVNWPISNTNVTNATQKLFILAVRASGTETISGIADISKNGVYSKLFDLNKQDLGVSSIPIVCTQTYTEMNSLSTAYAGFIGIVIS